MNNNTHTIELFIASLLFLLEGICYIINELAGFHSQAAEPSTTTSKQSTYQRWEAEIISMTIKQLQEMTGIKSSKYNKRALQQVALAGITSYLY